MPKLPENSVRGRVRGWIERHADKLGDDVLEIGSRQHSGAWWCNNRDLARGNWYGIDAQAGDGVDAVMDVERLPVEMRGRFSGVLCSEVLEHVQQPWVAMSEMRDALRPGGWLVVTTLTTFPVHGFPDDYYRFTESGLSYLMERAGFVNVQTATAGSIVMVLDDHGAGVARRDVPIHVFAVGRRRE